MTIRNIIKELCFNHYIDMENGNDIDTIDYHSLSYILEELIDRIEQLEQRLDKEEEYRQEQND